MIEVERVYFLNDQDSRKFDKYLARIEMNESEFLRKRIMGVINDIRLEEDVDMIIDLTIELLGCDRTKFFEGGRKGRGTNDSPNPTARRVITYILRNAYNMKQVEIGRKLGRDHSSINSSLKWMKEREEVPASCKLEMDTIKEVCQTLNIDL